MPAPRWRLMNRNSGTGQVPDGPDRFGVARCHHQALLPPGQVDEFQGHAFQVALDEGHVVGVGLGVQHVAAPQVGPALAQGHQASQAPHVSGGQAQAVVPAAQQGGQQIKGVVMAAQHHQGAVDVLRRHQQLG